MSGILALLIPVSGLFGLALLVKYHPLYASALVAFSVGCVGFLISAVMFYGSGCSGDRRERDLSLAAAFVSAGIIVITFVALVWS
jgi:hypothetical protein